MRLQNWDPPASTSPVLGLQMYVMITSLQQYIKACTVENFFFIRLQGIF